jgi:4-amino-4-deoxy-L-arabinose transferase-like glycosyltransferase
VDSPLVSEQSRHSVPHEVWWIPFVGAVLRLTFFFLAENNGGDALARAAMTAGWLQHPGSLLNFEPWLPMHFWLMAGLSAIVRDPGLGTRMLSLLLGVASLGIFWMLTKEVYDRSAATLSLMVFALYSLHIGYSTTSSSEVPYLFFLLVGLLAFFVYRRSGSSAVLALGAVALGIGAGIRYEAWVCIFALAVILIFMPRTHAAGGFWRTEHVREVLLFGTIAGSWPLFWLIYQWKVFGRPLYGVTMNYKWVVEQVAIEHRSRLYHIGLSPAVILLTLSPVIVAASFYGLALGLRESAGREFAMIFVIMGAVFSYQILAGGLLPLARYTITLGTLLALASGYGLDRFGQSLSQRGVRQFRTAVALMLVINLGGILTLSEMRNRFSDQFSAISPRLRFRNHIEEVRRYLKPLLNPDDSVVIDDYNVESNIIAAAIGLPLDTADRAFLASSQPVSKLPDYMDRRHPRFLIYSDRGVLNAYLTLPGKCTASFISLNGMEFRCLFANEIYRVYEIIYCQPRADSTPAQALRSLRDRSALMQ